MRRLLAAVGWLRGPRLLAVLVAAAGSILGGYVAVAWIAADCWLHWESPPLRYTLDSVPLDVEPVEFASRTGDRLAGWYVRGAPGGTGCPAETVVVLLHGFSDRKESLLPHAAFLRRQGCDVLLFDFSGSGDSDGVTRTVGVRAQEDARGALDYLEERAAASGTRLRPVLMGISMGAVVALAVGSDARVDAVVAEAPYSDYPSVFRGWLRGRIGTAASLVAPLSLRMLEWRGEPGVRSLSAVDAAARLEGTPLFVIEDALDGDVPAGSAAAIVAAVRGDAPAYWRAPEAGHGQGLAVRPGEYQQRVLAFIRDARSASATGHAGVVRRAG